MENGFQLYNVHYIQTSFIYILYVYVPYTEYSLYPKVYHVLYNGRKFPKRCWGCYIIYICMLEKASELFSKEFSFVINIVCLKVYTYISRI